MKVTTSIMLFLGGGLLLAGFGGQQTQPVNPQIYAQQPKGRPRAIFAIIYPATCPKTRR
jgi:Zn-dependent protease